MLRSFKHKNRKVSIKGNFSICLPYCLISIAILVSSESFYLIASHIMVCNSFHQNLTFLDDFLGVLSVIEWAALTTFLGRNLVVLVALPDDDSTGDTSTTGLSDGSTVGAIAFLVLYKQTHTKGLGFIVSLIFSIDTVTFIQNIITIFVPSMEHRQRRKKKSCVALSDRISKKKKKKKKNQGQECPQIFNRLGAFLKN